MEKTEQKPVTVKAKENVGNEKQNKAKQNRKAFIEPWKLKNGGESGRPGRFCLEESVSDIIQGTFNYGEQGKNLTSHHARISKEEKATTEVAYLYLKGVGRKWEKYLEAFMRSRDFIYSFRQC